MVKQKEDSDSTVKDVIVRSLKQPNCTNATSEGKTITIDIEKELGVEIVGDTKIKVAISDEEEPWDVIDDTEYTDKINIYTTVKLGLTEHTDKINDHTTGNLEITEHTDKFNIHSTENMEITEYTDKINIHTTEKLELTEKTEIISSENILSSTEIKEQNLCDEDCETCDEMNNSICLTCKSPKILNEGKCVISCENDEFIDNNGIKKCKCKNQKCLECSEQSLSFDLCI
jgi:hypothetical protein